MLYAIIARDIPASQERRLASRRPTWPVSNS